MWALHGLTMETSVNSKTGYHKGSLVVMALGGVMALIGILALVLGGSSLDNIGDDWVGERRDWEGEASGQEYTHEVGDMMYVYTEGGDGRASGQPIYDCSEFSLNVTIVDVNVTGVRYINDLCMPDGKLPAGHGDDPGGYLHYGAIRGLKAGETYTINTTCEENETRNYKGYADEMGCSPYIYLVNQEVLDDVIGSFLGGIFGIGGGSSCLCCGIVILLVGLIMALTMKPDIAVKVTYDSEGRVIVQDTGSRTDQLFGAGSASPTEDQQSWEAGLAGQTKVDEESMPDEDAETAGEWWGQEES